LLQADQVTPQAKLAPVRVAAECQGRPRRLDRSNSGARLMRQQQAHAIWRITKDCGRIGAMSREGFFIFFAIQIGQSTDDQSGCLG
jgi:hypothetical protein